MQGVKILPNFPNTIESGSLAAVLVCQVFDDAFVVLALKETKTLFALHQFTLPPSVSLCLLCELRLTSTGRV